MTRPTRCDALTIALAGCMFTAGCATATRKDVRDKEQRSEAMLVAARAHRINMFGSLSSYGGPAYHTTAAVALRQHTFGEVGADFDPDIDASGSRLVFASTRHSERPDLYLKATDGVAVTQLTSDPSSDIQPAFSPDGTRVAFASDRSGNWDVWVMNVDGDPPVQITSGPADEVHPSWSPDGSRLVYCSRSADGAQWELWLADAGAGSRKQFIGYGLFPEWSPVEDTIAYQQARERGSRWFSIWTVTLVNGEPRYPTEVAASAHQAMILPAWSADGQRLAYAAASTPYDQSLSVLRPGASSRFELWMMNTDGRGKVRLSDGLASDIAPTFSADQRIYFMSDRAGHENIWSLPAAAAFDASAFSNGDVSDIGRSGDMNVSTGP